jgi:hypothetical protein
MVKLQHTSKLKTCSVQHCGQFFVASGSENCLLAFKHETAQRSHGHISGNHTLDGCVLECRFFVFERFLLRALRVWLLFLFFPNDFHCDMRATDSEESKQMSKRTKDESAKQTLNKSWPPVSILDVCSWSVDGWSLCASTQATGGGGGSMSRRRRQFLEAPSTPGPGTPKKQKERAWEREAPRKKGTHNGRMNRTCSTAAELHYPLQLPPAFATLDARSIVDATLLASGVRSPSLHFHPSVLAAAFYRRFPPKS